MSLRRLWRLGSLLNRRTRRRILAANAGLTLGALLVVLFVSTGLGLRHMVLHDLLAALPVNQIRVQAKHLDLGPVRLGRPKFLGGGSLDAESIRSLRAIHGVDRAYPIAYARFPVSLYSDILGSGYGTDAPLQGVDSTWVAEDIATGQRFSLGDGKLIPLLVSRKILQAYNLGFAAANQLPRLTEQAIIGREVTVILGASSLNESAGRRVIRPGRVVGFSDRIDPLGVGVPLDVIAHYQEQIAGDPLDSYDAVVLVARASEDLPAIEQAVRRKGLEITTDSRLARQIGGAITLVIVVLSLVGVLIVALALANIMNTLALIFEERRFELGVARAVGVSRRLLRVLLVGEAVLSGILSAGLSLAVSWLLLSLSARALTDRLEEIIGAAPLFPIPIWLIAAVFLGTPLASFIAAIVPALRVTAPSIASALRR